MLSAPNGTYQVSAAKGGIELFEDRSRSRRNRARYDRMTGRVVIDVENLSKFYRLGSISGRTLREDLSSWWARVRGRPDPLVKIGDVNHGNREGKELWALRDISFQVQEGEVLGVIGRNGAGKSTLLKILSRITAPSNGRAVIRGRIGSLLEVGTGFHQELSGRENIYLNGAILGMKRREITSQINKIIDFSGVSRFIDTPVKRYSSGMTVRLAFAVAAHLEPEILIIDEVLAVGDADFQNRCMGKMEEMADSGRTILFVSHNMTAIRSLCDRALLIAHGAVEASGSVDAVTQRYLLAGNTATSMLRYKYENQHAHSAIEVLAMQVGEDCATDDEVFSSAEDIPIYFTVKNDEPDSQLCIGFDLLDEAGNIVLRTFNTDSKSGVSASLQRGVLRLRVRLPARILNAGKYSIAPRIGIHNRGWIIKGDPLVFFTIRLDHGETRFWDSLKESDRPGVISPIIEWRLF